MGHTLFPHFHTPNFRSGHIARCTERDFDCAAVQDDAEDDSPDLIVGVCSLRAKDGDHEQSGNHEEGSHNHDGSPTDFVVEQQSRRSDRHDDCRADDGVVEGVGPKTQQFVKAALEVSVFVSFHQSRSSRGCIRCNKGVSRYLLQDEDPTGNLQRVSFALISRGGDSPWFVGNNCL